MILKIPFLPYQVQVVRMKKKMVSETALKNENFKVNRDYNKIFCIGFGKTGTTSMTKLLSGFGFKVGNQAVAEVLAEDWSVHKRTERIISFCYTADAFQDAPFSYPGLYKELDKAFPGSKFILTVRDNPEQWFDSLVRFHTKLFSSDKNRPPDEEDKRNALYRYKGYMLESARNNWDYPNVPMYDENKYKQRYINHIEDVRAYFTGRPDDFIEINIARKEDFRRLCSFLGITTTIEDFPWENKT
jgi:hypothetical protein